VSSPFSQGVTTTANSTYISSFDTPVINVHSGEISRSSVIAIAVVFPVVGTGFLLCLVYLFLARRRRRQEHQMKGAPRVVFTHYPSSLDSRVQVIPRPYDHSGDLQSWINARIEQSGHEGAGSSTLASPTNSDAPEVALHKDRSSSASGTPKVPRKPLPYSATQRAYSDGQRTDSSLASPSKGWNGVVNRIEAIPIPNGRSHMSRNHTSSVQDRLRGSPDYETTSSELFHAAPAHIHAPSESSPTPSSMCIHDMSRHSHEEPRGLKIGIIPSNVPLVHFPQDHEGHISARASMHSGNTHVAHIHGFQRTRTSSLPLAQVRKAHSVENIGATKKPQGVRRPSRKEVPRYVLDESGQPGEFPSQYRQCLLSITSPILTYSSRRTNFSESPGATTSFSFFAL
jgi:hypothetical protein